MMPNTDLIATDIEEIIVGQLLFDADVTAKAARKLKPEPLRHIYPRHDLQYMP